jgi:ABC-type phosphate/phosphonate transport system substrate-binding protein
MRGSVLAVWLALGAASGAATAQSIAPATGFRIGVVADAPAACAAETGTSGADALALHLTLRLQRPAEICTFASMAEAGKALAARQIDFVKLDAAGMASAGSDVRPLLAPRAPGSIGRILSVAVVKSDAPAQRLEDIHGMRVAFAGANPAHHAGPKAALSKNGLPADAFASELLAATPEAALLSLQMGKSDVLVMHASAWQRVCRGQDPKDKPCAGLREVFRGREPVSEAFVVRIDLEQETRLRLVGILVALHLENRTAFDWMAPGAAELTPTEASAFGAGSNAQ